MSKQAFVPVGTAIVPVPGHRAIDGSQPKRICQQVKDGRWVSVSRPHVVEATSREALLLRRMAKRGDVLPFDAETATACGCEFRPLEWGGADVGWVTTRPHAATKFSRSSSTARSDSSTKDDS